MRKSRLWGFRALGNNWALCGHVRFLDHPGELEIRAIAHKLRVRGVALKDDRANCLQQFDPVMLYVSGTLVVYRKELRLPQSHE